MKKITTIKYEAAKDPEVMEITNTLAILEKRKPLDAIRQLILHFGPIRIQELQKPSRSAEPTEI